MTHPQQTSTPSPGWYPSPSQAGMNRYWNGEQWTEHVAPVAAPQPQPAMPANAFASGASPPSAKSDADKLALWGYITAIVFPIVGLILGFKLRRLEDSRGNTVLIVAVVVMVLGVIATLADPPSGAISGMWL